MKEIKILILVIVILVGILVMKIYTPKHNNSKTVTMSKQEIIELLQKGNNYESYRLKYRNISDNVNKTVKGNIVITQSDLLRTWHDLDTKEQITINDNAKTANIFKNDNLDEKLKELPAQQGMINIMQQINDSNVKTVKEEEYKGKKCIVVHCEANIDLGEYRVVDNKEKANAVEFDIWIESATGLVLKQEGKNSHKIKNTTEFDIQLNVVKDEEIVRPNLSGYRIEER